MTRLTPSPARSRKARSALLVAGTLVAATVPLVTPTVAGAAGPACTALGDPFDFGEFVAGSISSTNDTVAGGAAYGSITSLSGANIATSTSAPAAVPSGVTLELGGASNSISTTTVAHGIAEYTGSYANSGNTGTFTHVSTLPISFSTDDSALASDAATLTGLPATNTATGTTALALTSTGTTLDVFDLTASQVSGATSSITLTAPSTAVVVVNVADSNGGLSLSGQTVTLAGGVTPADVIWNFTSLSTIAVNSVHWSGTILDSATALSLSSSTINGSVLVGGMGGTSLYANNVNFNLFTGCIPGPGTSTPEVPVGLLLPLAGIAVIGGTTAWRIRRRHPVAAVR